VRSEIREIKEKINSETGVVIKTNPNGINEHDAATIVFDTEPLVVEKFAEIPELGRFILVKNGRNIGAGVSIGVTIGDGGIIGIKRGDVFGLVESPPKPTKQFLGEAVLLGKELKRGEALELRCGTAKVRSEIREIKEKINSETGVVIKTNPNGINEHDAATIVFDTEPLVVEKFAEIPELGRFILVKNGRNIGAGVVLDANFSFKKKPLLKKVFSF